MGELGHVWAQGRWDWWGLFRHVEVLYSTKEGKGERGGEASLGTKHVEGGLV